MTERLCPKTQNDCINNCHHLECFLMRSSSTRRINIDAKVDENIIFRLGEDKVLKEFENYVTKTYTQHYAGGKQNSRQTIEAIMDRGHGEGFCIGNAQKYLERYGFKNGKNRDDLMKAMHYCLLAIINHDKFDK